MRVLQSRRSSLPGRWQAILAGLISIALFKPGPVSAQNLSSDQQKSTISGTVINAVTRAPVPRALVSSADSRYAALTDSAGHFEFDVSGESADASPGGGAVNMDGPTQIQIWLTARKPGFLVEGMNGFVGFQGGNGTLAIPGREATIALTPEALIVGRVAFSTPDTTSQVNVQLFSRQVQDGLPRWIQQGATSTNSAGEFRFAGLQPGSYKLSTSESLDNDPGAMFSRSQVYGFPPVYYPGAADFETAGTIQVAAGQTFQADLALTRQAYYPVRIPINGDASNGVMVVVSSQGHRGPGYSLGFNDAAHRIEGMLPNGNFVVDAITYRETPASGTANLRVAGGSAEGSALTLVPNGAIVLNVKEEFSSQSQAVAGSMRFDGGFSVSGARSFPIRGPRTYLQATLEPADDFKLGMNATLRPPLGPNDDSLVITTAAPGRYWLRLNTGRGYVASATMGALDLLHQPLVISAGSGGAIDITMRDEFASVEGSVGGLNPQSANSSEAENAYVYFVPLPESGGQFQQTAVPMGQHFRFEPLVPGSYRVLTFSRPQPNLPYRDTQAMKAYETKGQVIHVAPGQKANLQLQVVAEE